MRKYNAKPHRIWIFYNCLTSLTRRSIYLYSSSRWISTLIVRSLANIGKRNKYVQELRFAWRIMQLRLVMRLCAAFVPLELKWELIGGGSRARVTTLWWCGASGIVCSSLYNHSFTPSAARGQTISPAQLHYHLTRSRVLIDYMKLKVIPQSSFVTTRCKSSSFFFLLFRLLSSSFSSSNSTSSTRL